MTFSSKLSTRDRLHGMRDSVIIHRMSEMCYNCFKPKSACLCSYTKEIDPGIKFVLLMHQKEAKRQRTGTGHIAKISLKDSEILVGFEFEHNKRLQELLHDPQYFPVMMYPGEQRTAPVLATHSREKSFLF